MRYKIGDVARILGISTDLLRYYEKKGVVTPMKDAHNDYRYYEAWDINYLMDCLWFKNFGFSIEQIADIVRIPSHRDIADLLEYKEDELRAAIARAQLLLRRSELNRRELEDIDRLLGKYEIAESPALVSYLNRVGDEYPAGDNLEQMARRWLSVMPFNHRYFEIDGDSYRWGFGLYEEFAEALDFPVQPPMERKEPVRSIHTVFRSRGKGNFSPHRLREAMAWTAEQGYEPTGPARGVLLASVLEQGVLNGYFSCWIPIA